MRTFSKNLTGVNCRLGDQTLINLSVTESVDSDYDTASAVCLAPGGPYAKGSTVHTQEGGVDTGGWVVEDSVTSKSGQTTLRRKHGGNWAHVPLVSYKLRRAGYLQARTTLSPMVVGADHYPPKFCTLNYMSNTILPDLQTKLHPPPTEPGGPPGKATIDQWEYNKQVATWHPVNNTQDIILTIAAWVGLAVNIQCSLDYCADTYSPVDKPAITAIKEAAAWSGASTYLDRTGTLQIYDPMAVLFGGNWPSSATVLSEEFHDTLVSPTHVTVVGQSQANGASTIGGMPWWIDPAQNGGVPVPSWWTANEREYGSSSAIEVTESLAGSEAAHPVCERIEIRAYGITRDLARRIARERLAQVFAAATASTYTSPAEGSQGIRPLHQCVTSVNRRLDWTGTYYKYELSVTCPRKGLSFGSETGWW